jgi:hypothetical protein
MDWKRAPGPDPGIPAPESCAGKVHCQDKNGLEARPDPYPGTPAPESCARKVHCQDKNGLEARPGPQPLPRNPCPGVLRQKGALSRQQWDGKRAPGSLVMHQTAALSGQVHLWIGSAFDPIRKLGVCHRQATRFSHKMTWKHQQPYLYSSTSPQIHPPFRQKIYSQILISGTALSGRFLCVLTHFTGRMCSIKGDNSESGRFRRVFPSRLSKFD